MTGRTSTARRADDGDGPLIVVLLLIAALAFLGAQGCSFPDEGEPGDGTGDGDGSGSAPPPRWPLAPSGSEGSSGSEGAGGSAWGTEGGSSSSEAGSSGESDSEGSSGLGESSSTGLDTNTYGPCDESCVAPWGCTSNGAWERCVLPCATDGDCPYNGACDGAECYAPCPCEGDAVCMGESCWWPV